MSSMVDKREPWEIIEEILDKQDAEALKKYLSTISSAEVTRAISRMNEENQARLLTLLEPEEAANLLEEIDDLHGADLIEELPVDEAATIINEMESDHRADILHELDTEEAEAILDAMDPEEAQDARQLLTYDENTAGGLMITEYLSYDMNNKVSDVIDDLRKNAEKYADFWVQYAYVLTPAGRLVGVARLRDLILAPGDAPLSKVMIANPLYVYIDTPLDELNLFFDRYNFVGVPVVDHHGRMMGVVRRGDAEEAYSEQAEQTLLRFGGIIGGEEFRSMPLAKRAFRRIAWLLVNLTLSLGGASVIYFYQGTIQKKIALTFFMPIVANISGCTGNQSVAVSIRELVLGIIKPADFYRVLFKEMQMAMIIGLVLGISVGTLAYIMTHELSLTLIVGIALLLNSIVSLSFGGLLPLILRKIKADPALIAPLLLTTMTDMCGFFFILTFATIMLKLGWL